MSLENSPLKRWLSPKDLVEEFGISLSNQARLRMENKIPYSKVGHYIRYDREKLNQWLENNSIDVA